MDGAGLPDAGLPDADLPDAGLPDAGLSSAVATVLPAAVRPRVLALAAAALASISDSDLPPSLRTIKRFTPARRTRLGGAAIAAGLEVDPRFRQEVAAYVRQQSPDLAAACDDGGAPPAADPVEVAAIVYLTRPAGWEALVAAGGAAAHQAAMLASDATQSETVVRLQEQLASVRTQARKDAERARTERESLRTDLGEARAGLRESLLSSRRLEERLAEAQRAADQLRDELRAARQAGDAELRRIRRQLVAVEANLETARRSERDGRALGTAKAKLLLDVISEASLGLVRELALPTSDLRPADLVAAVEPTSTGFGDAAARARADDDPALLDELLGLPHAHLVVDGYNVTKLGYGALPLSTQRARLIAGLAGLGAQTGAEITCCFDGAQDGSATLAGPARGVRVMFSRSGETADELIRRLVANEPAGRPVVVVSSDREVADGVRTSGARPVASMALLRRLERV